MLHRIPVDLIYPVVMRGLDPRIHHLRKTCAERMDPRVKPADDRHGWVGGDDPVAYPHCARALTIYMKVEFFKPRRPK